MRGPAIVICSSPCVERRAETGLSQLSLGQQEAGDCGCWSLHRLNLVRRAQGEAVDDLALLLDDAGHSYVPCRFFIEDWAHGALPARQRAMQGFVFQPCSGYPPPACRLSPRMLTKSMASRDTSDPTRLVVHTYC